MTKMKGEILVFRKCCFCFPLRRGLLAWAYFKMIADVCLVLLIAYTFIYAVIMMLCFAKEDDINKSYPVLIISIIAVALFLMDFVVTIVFIVGDHKKNVRLIRLFYFLSIGLWVASFLLTTFTLVMMIQETLKYNDHATNLLASCFYFVLLVVQTYFLLLVRSEVIKLKKSGEFRSVNNAAEAECTKRCEEVIVATEAVKTDKLRDPETKLLASQMTDA